MAAKKVYSALLSDGTRIEVRATSGKRALAEAAAQVADREGVTVKSVSIEVPIRFR